MIDHHAIFMHIDHGRLNHLKLFSSETLFFSVRGRGTEMLQRQSASGPYQTPLGARVAPQYPGVCH